MNGLKQSHFGGTSLLKMYITLIIAAETNAFDFGGDVQLQHHALTRHGILPTSSPFDTLDMIGSATIS